MENTLKKPMTGIIPPLVTPLLDNDKLDIDGLERLIERLIKGGVHGLFILGTTGEAQSISYRLRHEMIRKLAASMPEDFRFWFVFPIHQL